MTTRSLHVTVLGIDGSGKSTVTAALPALLAAEMGARAGAAGERFRAVTPAEDLFGPDFAPAGVPIAVRAALWLRRLAKRFVDSRLLYPLLKIAQMLAQDLAARVLARRHALHVMVSDGNALLCTMGRAANYLSPASSRTPAAAASARGSAPTPADLRAAMAHVADGTPLPAASAARLPSLHGARRLSTVLRRLGLGGLLVPDVVVFLDVPPARALERIHARGRKPDRHENLADMEQARRMYLRAIEAFAAFRTDGLVLRVPAGDATQGEILARIAAALRPLLARRRAPVLPAGTGAGPAPLGTSDETTGGRIWARVLHPRYLFRYMLPYWFRGAWRETTFLFSRLGRVFLAEGYSAGVMRLIYDETDRARRPLDRAFLGYPLHRAVYDRLHILVGRIEPEIERRLSAGREVRIFTAPCGVGYDVLRPIEAIVRRRPELAGRIEMIAADLDPRGDLGADLEARARALGIGFSFVRGDLTRPETRADLARSGEFDVALFVGLSSWLPKPATLAHLSWLRDRVRDDGVLVTDSFTAGPFAVSGRMVGYRAHYYEPDVYRGLLSVCGFEAACADVATGRDGLNHVVVGRPRCRKAAPGARPAVAS